MMAKKRKNSKASRELNAKNEEPKKGTRSSARKPKKRHSDVSEDDYKLRDLVESDGRTIVDMTSDGNCLFRALSDQLYRDYGNNHDEIRSDICDFMEENKDDFKLFLVLDDDDCEEGDDGKDFESYIANMRRDGEWGGNLELVAAARLYGRKITVFSATLKAFTIDHGDTKTTGPDLLVSFHDSDHYNSVRDKNEPPKPSVLRKPIKNLKKAEADETAFKTPQKSAAVIGGCDKTNTTAASLSELSVEDKDTIRAKPKKKNDPCPCGSGLRCKRCCHAREKHAARLEKVKGKSCEQTREDVKQEVTMKGNFRILQI